MGCVPVGSGLLELVAIVLGVYALGSVLRFFALLQQSLRAKISPHYEEIDQGDVPAQRMALYRPVMAELAGLGFSPQGWLHAAPVLGFPQLHAGAVALLRHRDAEMWALVDVGDLPERWHPVSVSFWSLFEDGSAVLTVNGARHGILDMPPRLSVVDAYAPTLAGQWLAHGTTVERAKRTVRQLETVGEFIAAVERLEEGYVADLRQRRRVQDDGRGGLELRLSAAVSLALQTLAGTKRMRRMWSQRARMGIEAMSVPVEQEAVLFARLERLRRQPGRWGIQVGLFFLTALLFVGSMALLIDPLAVVLLGAVVLFHELGHYVAMRALGFADTTIFFLPFLGAATVGRREGAPVVHELVILLAGPLPGLLLACLLTRLLPAGGGSWLYQAQLMLVVVNLFNLLPIFPLDGGRVLYALIFRRQRWLEAIFLVAAGLSLFALGVRFHSTLLSLIGVAVAATVPHRLRLGALLGLLRARPVQGGESAALRIFRLLNEQGYAASSFGRKVAVARGLLQRIEERRATASMAVVGVLVYLASLVGAMLLLVSVAMPQHDPARWANRLAAHRLTKAPAHLWSYRCGGQPPSLPSDVGRGPSLYLDCQLAHPGQAQSLERSLRNYFDLAAGVPQLRPPWRSGGLAPAVVRAQERARTTYRRLQAVAQRSAVEPRFGARGFYRRFIGCGERSTDPQAQMSRLRSQQVEAVRRYAASSQGRDLDQPIVRAYTNLLEGDEADEPRVLAELARRMGQLDAPRGSGARGTDRRASARPAVLGQVERRENKVTVPFLWVLDQEHLVAVMDYLCRAGCRPVRIGVISGANSDSSGADRDG